MLMPGSGNVQALFGTFEQKDVGLHEATSSQFSVDGLTGLGGSGLGGGPGDGLGPGCGPGWAAAKTKSVKQQTTRMGAIQGLEADTCMGPNLC